MADRLLGIDIGGSGMKAALVDTATGELVSDRHRIETPSPATPDAMHRVFDELCSHFDYRGRVGCAFPGVVLGGRTIATAANLDQSWVGVDAAALFGDPERPVTMVNDADAAGLAEMRFGAAANAEGTVLMVTIGTGLGTAVFRSGVLIPNTEFGHVEINGFDAERRASSRVIDDLGLSVDQWLPRINTYLQHMEELLWPDLIVLGGGISKSFEQWGPRLDVRAKVVPATMRNKAGIVGAAIVAADAG